MITEISNLGEFSDAKVDTMRYVARCMVGEVEKFIIMLAIFWLFSYQNHYLIASLVLLTVRPTAGGFHSNSALGCLLWTMSGFALSILAFPKLIPLNTITLFIVAMFCIIVNVMIAPLMSKQHEKRLDVTKNKRKKIILVLIHLLWFSLVFLASDYGVAPGIMWILFFQSCQLLVEYVRRDFETKKENKGE